MSGERARRIHPPADDRLQRFKSITRLCHKDGKAAGHDSTDDLAWIGYITMVRIPAARGFSGITSCLPFETIKLETASLSLAVTSAAILKKAILPRVFWIHTLRTTKPQGFFKESRSLKWVTRSELTEHLIALDDVFHESKAFFD
jgi:hypothetical protein